MLRLANAFLTSEAPVFLDSAGEVLEITPSLVDRKYGVITVTLEPGTYTVTYTSGFTAEEDIYVDVPDWMKSIALSVMFLWLRSMGLAAASKTASHHDLNMSIVRELRARIYERYDRPRANHEFHVKGERRAVGDTGDWNEW
jgi:hypothetical protein